MAIRTRPELRYPVPVPHAGERFEVDQPLAPRDPRRPSLAGRPHPRRPGRQVGPAGRVLVIGLTCLLVWALLMAPSLRQAAETSPIGARRTAALAVVRPLARVSAFFGLDRIGSAADRALGRDAPLERPPPPEPKLTAGAGAPSSPLPSRVGPDRGVRPSPSRANTPRPPAWAPVLPRPTAAHPLRVLVVGDSVGWDLAIGLSRLLSGRAPFELRTDAREASGLARPDYFDWPARVGSDLDSFRPGVVVAMFGANDAQGLLGGDHPVPFGSPEWRSAYRKRVAALMGQVTATGRPLVWVGLPPMGRPALSDQMRMLNGIFRSEARKHAEVIYVDTWALFADESGGYSAYLEDGSGREQLVRERDGVHLTAAGDDRLADAVYGAMADLWRRPR